MEKKAIIRNYALSCFDDVKTIVFLDNAKNAGGRNEIIDYSWHNDMSVVGWCDQNDPSILYVAPTIGNKIYIKNASSLFYNSQYLEEIKGIEVLDTSETTDMCAMFCGCRSLVSLDLSSFNTSNVTNMHAMFSGCYNLKELNVSSFDTSNVEDMTFMFRNCWNLTNLDLSNFNTENVESMEQMFYCCDVLEKLDISKFNFSNIIDMSYMLKNCKDLMHLSLPNMKYEDVQNMIVGLDSKLCWECKAE